MLLLTDTTHTLELVSSSVSSMDYVISWTDITTTTFTPGSTEGNIASATTTVILAAPAASTTRQIKMLSIANKGTVAQTITLQKDVSATNYEILPSITLAVNESLQYTEDSGFKILNNAALVKLVEQKTATVVDCRAMDYYKIGTASENTFVRYCFSKDPGNPGAWVVGTPGLSGRTTDGTTAADAGCVPIWTPSTGSLYLTGCDGYANAVALYYGLIDILWVNSGIVVTTTTGQAITSIAWPARDVNGSTDGEGVYPALLVTAATTNAGTTLPTLTYVNSSNTGGTKTATMTATFPATAVAGTIIPFQLAAGDIGVRSLDTLTLVTSLVTGSVSLIMYRPVFSGAVASANYPITSSQSRSPFPGVRLYNGSCLHGISGRNGTGATNVTSVVTITER